MHINSISCGQGAPSLFLLVLAGEGYFPADVVIVADTGWETDMLWSNGQRSDAKDFFFQVTKPLAESYGLSAAFVRSSRRNGTPYPPIPEMQLPGKEDIPFFGSKGGRLHQSCTSKWKIQAIRQELRRRGATTATSYLGLTLDEVHRLKPNDVEWEDLAWPLVGYPTRDNWIRRYRRADANEALAKRNIPYIVYSQCDGCPHKDYARWMNNRPETVAELAVFEAQWQGQQYLTNRRKPLPEALMDMMNGNSSNGQLDLCDNGYCFQ
jgi:hypothetical protein